MIAINNSKWLIFHKPNANALVRLFCFPYAGGSSTVFRDWIQQLPNEIELISVELPGRVKRFSEPCYQDINLLINDLVPEIIPYFDKPYIFFGHSLGAIVSYEVASELKRRNQLLPIALIVSGRMAPHLHHDCKVNLESSDQEFIKEIFRLNGTPPEVLNNKELVNIFLPMLRSDFTVSSTYTYTVREPLPTNIIALNGLYDEITFESIDSWKIHTTKNFSYHYFNGNHFFINDCKKQVVSRIIKIINDNLCSTTDIAEVLLSNENI